jgi:hypothetical protein
MNSHTSPCDHMTRFVAKSYPEHTQVPRRVTGRLTVHRFVNINPDRSQTLSTVAQRKPQHHHLWSLRSESKSFFFLTRAIQKAGEGGDAPAPARRARGGGAAPARRGEAAPTQGGEAAPAQGGAVARGGRACSYTKC